MVSCVVSSPQAFSQSYIEFPLSALQFWCARGMLEEWTTWFEEHRIDKTAGSVSHTMEGNDVLSLYGLQRVQRLAYSNGCLVHGGLWFISWIVSDVLSSIPLPLCRYVIVCHVFSMVWSMCVQIPCLCRKLGENSFRHKHVICAQKPKDCGSAWGMVIETK